jgi:hypothetical protein
VEVLYTEHQGPTILYTINGNYTKDILSLLFFINTNNYVIKINRDNERKLFKRIFAAD